MTSRAIPENKASIIWTRFLTCQNAIVSMALALPGCAHAQERMKPESKMEWLAPIPCPLEFASPMPAQPPLGLALFRFDCPGAPAKFTTAKISRRSAGLIARREIFKGELLDGDAFAEDSNPAWISRAQDQPLDPAKAPLVQAKVAVNAGARLLARDFESRRLWIGGESIAITLEQGAVVTTLPGISTGVGRLGEPASAKSEGGRAFNGVAGICGAMPCLKVRS